MTPPAWSALAASTLSHALFLELADQSHGAFEGACGRNAVDHFVADPSAAPDVSCADALPPIALLAPRRTQGGGPCALVARSRKAARCGGSKHLARHATVSYPAQMSRGSRSYSGARLT